MTHVPWCMLGSLTLGGGENVPGIPGACATHNFTYLSRDPWGPIDSETEWSPSLRRISPYVRRISRIEVGSSDARLWWLILFTNSLNDGQNVKLDVLLLTRHRAFLPWEDAPVDNKETVRLVTSRPLSNNVCNAIMKITWYLRVTP